MLGGKGDQPAALLFGEGAAGRVVEVGDDVGELDRAQFEGLLERIDVDSVFLECDRHEDDPDLLEQEQGAVVTRLLDHDPVTG